MNHRRQLPLATRCKRLVVLTSRCLATGLPVIRQHNSKKLAGAFCLACVNPIGNLQPMGESDPRKPVLLCSLRPLRLKMQKNFMSIAYQIVVCGSIVPDPLQTLEPVSSPTGPALKNEMMLPAVLDPWASHALYEAANLAKNAPGSKVWLVSLGPKAKLQQVMMSVAQKVPFELIALDGPSGGFTEAAEVAAALAEAIQAIPGLDLSKLLVFGGWESASRGAGVTMQLVGERLGIMDQFQGVDQLKVAEDGSLEILERIEGGRHQISRCSAPPALLRLGDRQSARTQKQPPSRHAQHAHRDARAAEGKTRQTDGRRIDLCQRFTPQADASNQDRQRRDARCHRA